MEFEKVSYLNEFVAAQKLKKSDLPGFDSDLTQTAFDNEFNKAWNSAKSEIESEITPLKEDVIIKIGNTKRIKNFSYGNRITFTRSVIVIGILNYLSQTKPNETHLWWDEFEKINSFDTTSKLQIIKKYTSKFMPQIDYRKAIDSIQKSGGRGPQWSVGKARAYFASLLQGRAIQNPVKKQVEKLKGTQIGSIYSFLGDSMEDSIEKYLKRNEIAFVKHPLGRNQFPDFEIKSKGYKIFSMFKPGDYLEIKSKTITPTRKSIETIKNKFNLNNYILDAEVLNKDKIAALNFFGLSGNRNLYFFMKSGKSSSFSLYKIKDGFNDGIFVGKKNLQTGVGNLRYIVKKLDLTFSISKTNKRVGFTKPDNFKDRALELIRDIDASEFARGMGIIKQSSRNATPSMEGNIRAAREGGYGYSVAQENSKSKLSSWILENVQD